MIRRSSATRLPALELTRRLERLFDSLDFVYMPSRDVAADTAHFVEQFGASLAFAIEAFGTRVAMLNLSEGSPQGRRDF